MKCSLNQNKTSLTKFYPNKKSIFRLKLIIKNNFVYLYSIPGLIVAFLASRVGPPPAHGVNKNKAAVTNKLLVINLNFIPKLFSYCLQPNQVVP